MEYVLLYAPRPKPIIGFFENRFSFSLSGIPQMILNSACRTGDDFTKSPSLKWEFSFNLMYNDKKRATMSFFFLQADDLENILENETTAMQEMVSNSDASYFLLHFATEELLQAAGDEEALLQKYNKLCSDKGSFKDLRKFVHNNDNDYPEIVLYIRGLLGNIYTGSLLHSDF